MSERTDEILVKISKLKYKNKMKKLNISDEVMEILIYRKSNNDVKKILDVISNCKSKEEFKTEIINMCSEDYRSYMARFLLFGTLFDRYDLMLEYSHFDIKNYNLDNLKEDNLESTINILRNNFIEYINNNTSIKNKFLVGSNGINDYTIDLDEEKTLKIFDDVIKGNYDDISLAQKIAIRDYILNLICIYGKDNIENNMDFVLYDFNNGNENISLDERKQKYYNYKNLTNEQKIKYSNIEKLKSKLKTIDNKDATELLNRLQLVDESNIDELEDIYLDYELLFREDIINHLYVPEENITIVEDFRDLRPQLIHSFIRNPEKFRSDIKEEIIEDIIQSRVDGNKQKELTEEEQKWLERRLLNIDDLVDPTKVNYSFNIKNSSYTDSLGFSKYHSDTSNQISASIFSEEYFLNRYDVGLIGIGFNKEGLMPEAIAISSPSYLTTNKGLNNLEYDEDNAFDYESSTYKELLKNDGKSEIVMFRRNMDYDTKASYVFATIDSSKKEAEEILTEAKKYAGRSNMKLVIYDIGKIRNSYEKFQNEIENKEDMEHNQRL